MIGGFRALQAAGLPASGGGSSASDQDLVPGSAAAGVAVGSFMSLSVDPSLVGVAWTPGESGVPLIDGSLTALECSLER